MITLENVTDSPHVFGKHHALLEDANLFLPPGRYALLSASPEYHPALINVLAGLRKPRRGFVRRDGFVSWPIGRAGFMRGKLTGLQMTRFICTLYGLDVADCLNFLLEIMTNPEFLNQSIVEWPGYVRSEYIFSLSLIPAFDMFIVDTVIPIEETRFSRIWRSLFEDQIVGKSLLISNFRKDQLEDYCTKALVFEQGGFRIDEDLEGCLEQYPPRQSRAEQPEGDGQDVAELQESEDSDGLF